MVSSQCTDEETGVREVIKPLSQSQTTRQRRAGPRSSELFLLNSTPSLGWRRARRERQLGVRACEDSSAMENGFPRHRETTGEGGRGRTRTVLGFLSKVADDTAFSRRFAS